MFFILLILFLTVPFLELALLLTLGEQLGVGPTLAIVILTAFAGSHLVRREGLKTWQRIQKEMADGAVPGEALLDGVFIFAAGLLLLTPGVLTDALGFAFLIPPIRRLIIAGLKARLAASVQGSFTQVHINGQGGHVTQTTFGPEGTTTRSAQAGYGPDGVSAAPGTVTLEPGSGPRAEAGPESAPPSGPREIVIEAGDVRRVDES